MGLGVGRRVGRFVGAVVGTRVGSGVGGAFLRTKLTRTWATYATKSIERTEIVRVSPGIPLKSEMV